MEHAMPIQFQGTTSRVRPSGRRGGLLHRLLVAFVVWVLLPVPPAVALNPAKRLTQFQRNRWQGQHGLPENSVTCLAESRDGFLWVGTGDGLARFDGADFLVFDDRSAVANRNLSIKALCASRDGTVWFGTKGGLNRIERDRIVAAYTRRDGLPVDHIQALHEDKSGQLWAGSAIGLIRVEPGKFRTVALNRDGPAISVWGIADAEGGGLWLATDRGLVLFHDDRAILYGRLEGLPEGNLLSVAVDRQGNPWVGSESGFIARFANGVFSVFRPRPGMEGRTFASLAFDPDQSLWISTFAGGLLRFRNGNFESLAGTGEYPRDLHCVSVDSRGELWVGTSNAGLYQLQEAPFTPFGPPEGFSDQLTDLVMEDAEGAIWVGTGEENGADRWFQDKVTHFGLREGLPSLDVLTFANRLEGGIWIGTGKGLVSWNAGVIARPLFPGVPDGMAIFSVLEDSTGCTWLGTDAGLWELRSGVVTHHSNANGLPSNQVRTVISDRAGGVWVGTYDGGVAHLSADRKWRVWTTRDGLSVDFIRSLLLDDDGTLWIGTNGGGLVRIRGSTVFVFNKENGLPNDQVFQVLDDGVGSIWFPSLRGIHRVSKAQLEAVSTGQSSRVASRTFGTSHGMRSREGGGGVQPAAWRSRDGRLWFTGGGGVAAVNPRDIVEAPRPPKVMVSSAKVDRDSVPINKPIRVLPRLGDLTITFSAIELSLPDLVHYRFRLDGLEPEWREDTGNKSVDYTRLGPGDYRFIVQASIDGGDWGTPGEALEIHFLPHFYQTTWFDLALVVLALLVILVAVQWRMQSLVRRRTILAGLVAQRTRELEHSVSVLEQTNAELARATRVKSEFLANMSHEIRTPLNAVLGFSQLLLASGLNRVQRDFAENVRTSGEALLGLISDILDLTKIESGRLELEAIPFDAGDCVEQALDVFLLAAGDKRIDMVFRPDPAAKPGLIGDPTRLRQVLINLVGNAVKFTRAGEVVVTLRSEDLPDGKRQLEFSVRDTGIGIPADRMDRLFQPFSQVDSSNTREFGGSGLGLVICRRLVKLMGGSISVESQIHEGSTFRFTLIGGVPSSVSESEPTGAPPATAGMKLLILEPNTAQRERLTELAVAAGLEVVAAADAKSLGESLPVHLNASQWILAEVKSAAAVLDQAVAANPELVNKVVWLDFRQGTLAGDGALASRPVLVKPIRVSRFHEALGRASQAPASRRSPRSSGVALPALRILVGEDNPVNRHLAQAMLGALGQTCELFEDGERLYQALKRNGADVVIADLQMPLRDGAQLARSVRSEMGTGSRPYLITLTAAVTLEDRQRCLDAGMDDFLTKPLRLSTLREALQRADAWLARHRNGYGAP